MSNTPAKFYTIWFARMRAREAIFESPPLDCACTKMSKTLQSLQTCFKQKDFVRKNFKKWLFITNHLKTKNASVMKKLKYC